MPIRVAEFARPCNVRVPPSANHNKLLLSGFNSSHCRTEILHKNNVAIAVAKHIVPRDVLSAREHIIHAIRSESVFLRESLVADTQLLYGDRASRLVAEKDYLCEWMNKRPAF